MLWKEPLVELDYFKTNTSIIRTTNVLSILKVKYWKLGSISELCNLSLNEVRHFRLSDYAIRKKIQNSLIFTKYFACCCKRSFDFKH